MPADGYGRQGIVYAEPAGHRNLHRKMQQAGHVKAHPQTALLLHKRKVLRPQVCRRIDPVGLQRTGMFRGDSLPVCIVLIDDTGPALLEQQTLTVQIILEIPVLPFADMIRLQIGKDAEVKDKALRPVQHQSLGRYLHHHRITASVGHLPEIFLHQIRFRRSVVCRNVRIADDDLDGADQSHLPARLLQNGTHKISTGGLPFCSRNADDLHLLSRMAEESSRQEGHRIPGIRHLDHRHIRLCRKLHLLLHKQYPRTGFHRRRREPVSVRHGARNADKHTARHYLPGVVDDIRHFSIQRAPYTRIFNLCQ